MCATDPLFFTCELNEVALLRVTLPSGYKEPISTGDNTTDVALPNGFTAVSLRIHIGNENIKNFSLTLSIANASLLAGGEIRCDNTTLSSVVSAGCPLRSKLVVLIRETRGTCMNLLCRLHLLNTDLMVLHSANGLVCKF